MKFIPAQMNQLIKNNKDLETRLKSLMKEMEMERSYALKALYHSEVADGGRYQQDYQALDPK
ncbi:hypothetical protein [Paenisporosarcina cavernae]|uniref:Uncharacterized protein n=1 Tax=Paenisporosarcina cavernae TaxID=2320858 RepID=A0A385YQ99_9BACL|nr:hypothetical protein [Paenisporosarcina cavernae]AYC28520.1 hypothetical protein D3873_01040 [Paenisporosarcina cavernae]